MAPNSFSLSTRINMAGDLSIPHIHLGVYLMSGKEAGDAVRHALNAGYRAVDSAQMYHNERECGQAVLSWLSNKNANKAGLKREDIFFTSKLASNSSYETARKSIRKSVQACGLGYIDLFLLHSPYGGKAARLASWKAVEDAIVDGEIRIGGVSNSTRYYPQINSLEALRADFSLPTIQFGVKHLEELIASKPRVLPAVNQIEVHPFNTRTNITSFCQDNGILVEAYAPLARALRMKHPTIVALAKKYNATPAQIMVRWSLQNGFIPLPKSVSKDRIESNGKIDSFELESDDMSSLSSLDEYLVTDWDPVDTD